MLHDVSRPVRGLQMTGERDHPTVETCCDEEVRGDHRCWRSSGCVRRGDGRHGV